MSTTMIVIQETIEKKIYLIRGLKVMLDKDLAELYGVKPIRLREQVKRNKERFPNDFMFQLTMIEAESMVSQNAIPSRMHLGGYLPYAFTEQGVAMLSSVLNSKRAIQVNIQIMRTFIKLKEIIFTHKELALKLQVLERKFVDHDQKFEVIFDAIKRLIEAPKKEIPKIGFKS